MVMRTLWFLAVVVLVPSCKKPQPAADTTSGSATPVAAAPNAAPQAPPAWTATSHPIELSCGDSPLVLTAPQSAATPASERTLKHGDAIAQCHDQASIEATCDCLAKSIAAWGTTFQLAGPATCTPQPNAQPDAAVVQLQDNPADPDSKTGGTALVLVAKRGSSWSAISAIDAEGDIDLTQTPKLTESAKLVAFEAHPIASGSLYSIETRSETRQSDMGDHDIEGGVVETFCAIPRDAHAAATCYAPLNLGTWSYTWTPAKTSCEISKLAIFAASFDATGVTMRLDHGSDADGIAGHYRF